MIHTDQIGEKISLPHAPKRVISLVPSQTELLHDLGLNQEVVGITRFCVHPQGWLKEKTKVGGTKNVNLKRIKSLEPDLIIANKEENIREQVEEMGKICPVWTSDVKKIEDNLQLIADLGELLERQSTAKTLIQNIEQKRNKLQSTSFVAKPEALYLIWDKPLMGAGNDTFIHTMLLEGGFSNYLEKARYPEILEEELLARPPEVLLLSSEPYSFTQKHVDEWKEKLEDTKVILVDGELFSWYGSRIQFAFDYLLKIRQQC